MRAPSSAVGQEEGNRRRRWPASCRWWCPAPATSPGPLVVVGPLHKTEDAADLQPPLAGLRHRHRSSRRCHHHPRCGLSADQQPATTPLSSTFTLRRGYSGPHLRQGRCRGHRPGDLVSADQDNPCPSTGTRLSAHREDAVSALSGCRHVAGVVRRTRGFPDRGSCGCSTITVTTLQVEEPIRPAPYLKQPPTVHLRHVAGEVAKPTVQK